MMPLHFIDNSDIDRRTRRLIRSHAATGKNVGQTRKSRRPRGGPVVRTLRPVTLPSSPPTDDDHLNASGHLETSGHGRLPHDGLAAMVFPSELSPRSQELVRKYFGFFTGTLFPPEVCGDVSYQFSGSIWIQLMFVDEIYLAITVALSAALTGAAKWSKDDSNEAAIQLARTFRLLNARLSGKEALADTTLATVVALSQYERYAHCHKQGLIHFEGLRNLVELRGGIAQLSCRQPALAQKIFRADLEFAVHMGSRTRYATDVTPGSLSFPQLRRRFEQISKSASVCRSALFQSLTPELQEALLDVLCFGEYLNGNPGADIQFRAADFHNALIYLGYRLVNVKPFGALEPAGRAEDTVQLGLICFLAHFLVGLDRKIPDFTLLSELTRPVIERPYLADEKEYQSLLLWLILVARPSIFREMDDLWLIPRLENIANRLNLRTWQDARAVARKYPWVNGLNDRPSEVLWKQLAFR